MENNWGYIKPPVGTPIDIHSQYAQGLIAAWLMNDRPGVLGKMNDASFYHEQGTLFGDTFTIAGKFGSALRFDGTGDFVRIDSFTMPYEGTFVAWVTSNWDESATDTGQHTLFSDGTGGTPSWRLKWQGGAPHRYLFYVNGSGKIIGIAEAVDFIGWWQIVVTWDVSGAVMYRNGKSLYTFSGDATQTQDEVATVMGANYISTTPSDFWDGDIDHALVYNRVLSAAEVAKLYLKPFSMFHKMPIEWWAANMTSEVGANAPTGNIWGPLGGCLRGVA